MLREWDWQALSYYLTPRTLQENLNLHNDVISQQSFERVKGTVMLEIWRKVPKIRLQRKYSSWQKFWEEYLMCEHFIPPAIPDHVHTVDRFFHWHEASQTTTSYPFASVELLRAYWQDMAGYFTTNDQRREFFLLCQNLLMDLPCIETQKRCHDCKWVVPDVAMFDTTKCNYCYGRRVYHQHRKIPYLRRPLDLVGRLTGALANLSF